MLVFLVFVSLSLIPAIAPTPISPSDYQQGMKQGFSTNWFKTATPLKQYNHKNIDDIYGKGFRNVRIRSRADLYTAPYTSAQFTWFLNNLTYVVDKCIATGVFPIISWIHHDAEAHANDTDRQNYVNWWTAVATKLKDRNYTLGFNLFTELGVEECGETQSTTCGESLREKPDKYNNWTSEVVSAIRATGGKNAKRILILGSPGKTAKDLDDINATIYENDQYMLAEWHIYGSGPNKKGGGQKYWAGDGDPEGQANVRTAIKAATDFTATSNLLTYLGAWMPTDNKGGSLDEAEVINFARYFVTKLKEAGIPSSINVLDRYYDTKNSSWLTDVQDIKGAAINMSTVLDNITDVM